MRRAGPGPDDSFTVGCFLCCSLMDPDELAPLGVHHPTLRPARLPGWQLTFTPDVDIAPAPKQQVEGFYVELAPAQAQQVMARKAAAGYHPVPVQVHTEDASPPAMAFASGRAPAPPTPEQLKEYLQTCWRLGIPKKHCDGVEKEAKRLQKKEVPTTA